MNILTRLWGWIKSIFNRETNSFEYSPDYSPTPISGSIKPPYRFFGRDKVTIYGIIKTCPGGTHAWYDSSVGPIRKQIQISTPPP